MNALNRDIHPGERVVLDRSFFEDDDPPPSVELRTFTCLEGPGMKAEDPGTRIDGRWTNDPAGSGITFGHYINPAETRAFINNNQHKPPPADEQQFTGNPPATTMAAESTITSPTDPAQLVGLYCLTAIVAQRGVTLVLKGAILDEDTAKRIWHREYLRQDLRFGCRKFNGKPVDVLQASQAKGSKLVDVDGNVY